MFLTLRHFQHPTFRPFRPIVLGILAFSLFNLVFSLGVTFSPLNQRFNFSYGNFLPAKLAMLRQAQPEQLDVLFLGTSQTNNGFITSVFERATPQKLNSFNLGLPNNRYDVMQAYLRFHIRQFGKPRLLLVELSPTIQEQDAHFYYLPALYYRSLIENDPTLAPQFLLNPQVAWNVKKELALSAFSSLHQYRYTFSPVNLLGKVSEKAKTLAARLDPAPQAVAEEPLSSSNPMQDSVRVSLDVDLPPEMTAKGWYPKAQSPHMTTSEGVRLSVAEARKYYIDSQSGVHFEKLRSLLAYCADEEIPVVLVTWPNHPAFLRAFEQSELSQAYQSGLDNLLERYPTPIINLNALLARQPHEKIAAFFADPRHLTPEGARYFSAVLAEQVFSQATLARMNEDVGPY